MNALLFGFNLVPRCLVNEVLGRGLGLESRVLGLGLGLEACVLDSSTAQRLDAFTKNKKYFSESILSSYFVDQICSHFKDVQLDLLPKFVLRGILKY